MRIEELSGTHYMMEAVSPEVLKAQKMAELEQIATYRRKRLEAYMAWSVPEAVKQRAEEARMAAPAALAEGQRLSEIAKRQIAERKANEAQKAPPFKISPISRPTPKRSWISRLLGI